MTEPGWQRAVVRRYGLLAVLLSVLLLAWCLWLQPQQQALAADQQALLLLTRTWQQRQQQWRQNPDIAQLQAGLQMLQNKQPVPRQPGQNTEAILAARHLQLEEWQPEMPDRQVTLHLQWPAFQLLFAELAEAAAQLPVQFRLLAQPQYLVAQLWLAPDDAP